jgi:hypothetical protein
MSVLGRSRVLCLDPANRTGWAIAHGHRVEVSGCTEGWDLKYAGGHAVEESTLAGVQYVVAERPHTNGWTIAAHVGSWMARCPGATLLWVSPSTWRSALWKGVVGRERKALKAHAMSYYEKVNGVPAASDDHAEAWCMATAIATGQLKLGETRGGKTKVARTEPGKPRRARATKSAPTRARRTRGAQSKKRTTPRVPARA